MRNFSFRTFIILCFHRDFFFSRKNDQKIQNFNFDIYYIPKILKNIYEKKHKYLLLP